MKKVFSCCPNNFSGSATMLEARLSEPQVKEVYEKIALVYDFWARLTETRARQIALEKSGIRDGMRVLEVAVGTSLLFAEIVPRNPKGKNIGVDLTQAMLAKAQKRSAKSLSNNYELKIGNALDLDYASENFDLLFNNYLLDLLPLEKINIALTEFHRVLRADGRLVLANMTMGKTVFSRVYEKLYKVAPRLMGRCRGVQVIEQLQRAGFVIEHQEYVEQFFFPSEVIVARKI